MSSDSDHTSSLRHHTHKRKKIIVSDSSSDESIIAQTRRRKKIYRVISEGESSSDDDSDVPKPVIRRQNYRVISEDEFDSTASEGSKSMESDSSSTSEWQSDWSSSDEVSETKEYNAKRKVLPKTKKEKIEKAGPSLSSNANISSDSGDEQSEKCPICLLPFSKQQIGTPSVCEHCFCLDCLLEWSKNINTCPVDRQSFTVIYVKDQLGGEIIKHLPVEVVPRVENQVQDDPTFCEVCHQSDREDRMLLCDNCDRGYHLECLTPPMTAVPIEEWYCPDCMHRSSRSVSNFVPTLMIPRRPGRRILQWNGRDVSELSGIFRILPHIHERSYVRRSRSYISRIRNRISEMHDRAPTDISEQFDPNLPSTSSGVDSIGDNSRSRSPNILEDSASSKRSKTKAKTTKKKKKHAKSANRRAGSLVREVRIKEFNDDGEEEEIVTYVKVATSTSRRKCKKRAKKTRKRRKHKRRARNQASMARTVKRRLASTLGMEKPKIPLLVPTVKNNIAIPDRSALTNARYSAGIPQVSLFGDNLGLDYSPPGSDNEYSIGNGPLISIRQRRSAVPSIRRRTVLKTIANPTDDADNVTATDLLSSIMSTMELWHSTKKKDDVILKADGTLIVNNPNKENKHSINNNESPKKEKQDEKEVTQRKEVILKEVDTPLDLSNVNPSDITQAPMYNNPCGGGGGGGGGGNRGNFRGGYGRDNGRHSGHGGQSYGGGRDSLPPGGGGRHNYSGGTGGGGPRDNFGNRDFGPPPFYNPNFEHCGGPPMFGAHAPPPPFRGRNPQHFRNERLRFPPPPPPPIERPFNYTESSAGGFEPRPPFPHAADRFPRPRPSPLNAPPTVGPAVAQPSPDPLNVQPAHVHNSLPSVSLPEDATRSYQSPERNDRVMAPEPVAAPAASARQDNDDCDIYCDIEPPSKPDCDVQDEHHSNGSMILLPPPEPPSGLLDFEENSRSDKDNDSEQELVIDDSHKEDTPKELPSGDKYDPFAADSDSNDDAAASHEKALQKAETSRNNRVDNCNIPMPVTPPLSSYQQPPAAATSAAESGGRERQEPIRLTAYDDDDDNNSQSDCPNFSIYSSQTMDVARHSEQELSQQLGPLQPPPLPPNIPDDDDIIVGDVQACDMPDAPPEPVDPYVEALQKERQTLSKIPPKKISHDSHRGKIIFKIGNKLKLNNRLSNLHSDDHGVNSQNSSFLQKKAAVPPTDEQQQQQDVDKVVSSSKPTAEVMTVRPLLSLKSTKTDSRFSDEDEKDVEPVGRRESKELGSENSTDEETAKADEKERHADASSPDRNESESSEQEASPRSTDAVATDENVVAVAESATMSAALDDVRLSSENVDNGGGKLERSSEDLESGDAASKAAASNRSDEGLRGEASACDDSWERESSNDEYDRTPSREIADKADRDDGDDDKATLSDNEEDPNSSDQRHEKASSSFSTVDDEVEQFPIKKDEDPESPVPAACADANWDSDGAYTPCKDELPVKDVQEERATSFEVGLEPITPTKDRTNDDLDDCRTPTGYAGLGTEAISETDEAINFEEELNTLLRKEKEMEDGEILDESKLSVKECEKSKEEKEDDGKRKKKKDKKEKSKESTEKNKENISSDNLVAWKKLSKSTKERPYRDKDKRSKSKEKEKDKDKDKDKSSKKKTKEVGKKKEKRKELPRYDVRKIVADKPRKDEYGRDIREKSRSRSKSRSPNKIRSGSRDRRSRSYSKGRSRSRSRLRLSWSRDRGRSYSRSCRSTSRRKSTSRTRRRSPRKRSASRRGSLSRRHSVSRRRSRSLSRKRRSLSPRRRSRRSPSRSRDKRKDKTKKYKSRSRSRNRKRSRSKSQPKRASSKSREKKHGKRKAHSRSRSKGKSVSRDRDRNRNWEQLNEKSVDREQQFAREQEEHERSWSAQWTPSWSRSRSKTPPHIQQERLSSRNWSPPPVLDSVSPKNLTVILTNKEAIKKKKKERRKESRKSKETQEKRRKGKRNRTPPPSKEVFASGDNILVSVCFNKDNETNPTAMPELPSNTIPLVPPIKRRRRESVQTESTPSAKRSKKEKSKDKRSKSPKVKKDKKKKSKAAEIAATKKPVAVIDLDQSPFREQTPSPRDVIVLSDDDDKQAQEALAGASPEQCPPSQASPPREQFVSQGPKTPPEPQIKFSINKQPSNLRPSLINPLLEEEEEEEEEEMMDEQAEEELEMRAQEELELRLKIGPNTPPEPPTSPPTSPDAYDPFDPTKSRSPTPDASQEATPNDEHDRAQRNSPRKHDGATDAPLPLDETNQQQDQPSQEKPTEKPKIISMVTIKRPSPPRDVSASPAPENQTDIAQSCNSPPKTQQNPQNVQSTTNPFATINPVLATVAAAVQRSFNTSTPNSTQRTLLQPNRISPSSQTKQRTNDRPQLPNVFTNSAKSSTMARSSKSNQSKNSSTIGQNGSDATMDTTNDNVVDMSSPYSPGSTLSDGLFDPPSPANFNNSPVTNAPPPAAKTNTPKVNKSAEKKDTFDALFGGLLPPVKTATKSKSKKAKEKTKKSTNPKVGVRMDENQLQILDDLPSSAVEMQVKDKFLKKLNRQERVVEEVKLVLKPHYTKKHVTKEEYKDIMRKAVPKICHNKTGEINPKKIAHLIEAYVRKCRNNKKKTISSTKIAKPTKTLWS